MLLPKRTIELMSGVYETPCLNGRAGTGEEEESPKRFVCLVINNGNGWCMLCLSHEGG